jgi:starch phosphorylase
MNGVPSLSILDGWWVEGCTEGVTGWAIGPDRPAGEWDADRVADAADLYDKLEHVAGLYSGNRTAWIAAMRGAMTINGPKFSTHRMIREYATKAYGLTGFSSPVPSS